MIPPKLTTDKSDVLRLDKRTRKFGRCFGGRCRQEFRVLLSSLSRAVSLRCARNAYRLRDKDRLVL